MRMTTTKVAIGVLFIAAVAIALTYLYYLYQRRSIPEKVSRFGEYRGYSEAIYDGHVRRSDYLTLSDGTKLAYDVLLPTKGGVPADEPLPVLFTHTPYLRVIKIVDDGKVLGGELLALKWYEKAFLWLRSKFSNDGHLIDQVFRNDWLGNMVKHGYVVVAVERAGTGASFGRSSPSWEVSAREANEILDWIAAQPWSNGDIGMYGASYEAMTQFAAASSGNPHLKAIFPVASSFDMYDALIYPGGVYNQAFGEMLPQALAALETMIEPVDGDKDGALLAQVLEERRTLGEAASEAYRSAPYRDSALGDGTRLWEAASLYSLLEPINRSGVPTYNSSGWYDLFTRDVLLLHNNLTASRRLQIRPLFHEELPESQSDLDFGAEAHRWFDYWLKDIDNGIMDEPPIHYYVMGAPAEDAWRTSDQWPLANQQMTRYYFAEGRTGSVESVNDGFLRTESPADASASDAYTVDYSTTSGYDSRWNSELGAGVYPDMRANDEKALTYTTLPLESDVEITGHAVVHLWIATEASDLDFFVYLEEVDPTGKSAYITEGNLRASHRALREAPFDNVGLPYQSSNEGDLGLIPAGEPIELVFDLLPTSKLFRKGKRIRVSITCADVDNFDTLILDPTPEARLLGDGTHASFIELPIIPGD